MTDTAPEQPSEPYEPRRNNLIRDRRKMRSQYGPYSYTRGMYVNGAQTPLKPKSIRIQSTIPIAFAVGFVACGGWFLVASEYPVGGPVMFGAAAFMLFLSWLGFRTVRLRANWERANPKLAKNIKH